MRSLRPNRSQQGRPFQDGSDILQLTVLVCPLPLYRRMWASLFEASIPAISRFQDPQSSPPGLCSPLSLGHPTAVPLTSEGRRRRRW